MNCCCFKSFFVFLCFQLPFFDPSFAAKLQQHENFLNDSFILNSNDAINEQLPSDNLLADGSVRAIADGNDIRLSGYGSINLTLTLETLQFEVCDSCEGSSKVCFDTAKVHSKAACSEYSSYCKFEVKYEKDEQTRAERIYFNDIWVSKNDFVPRCLRPTMHWGEVVAVETSKFMSCDPKIDGVDKIIKLYVGIEPSCPIKVINAKIYVPEVSTKNSSSNSTSADESSAASAPVWAIVIMVLGGIAVIIIIGGFACYLFKKRRTAKVPSQKTNVAKTTANVATLETPSKRKYDLNFTKFEPSKKSKKSQKKQNKKKTTQEKTEDAPVPHVTLPPTPTAAPPPEPAPYVPYAKIPRIFPRSLKSAKTDSLDETTKKDKLAMIEPASVSLHHHCIKPANPNLLAEMKKNYPETCHDVMEGEVDLFCSPVSKMFASINGLAREYEQKLTAVGCDFDEYTRIVSMSDGARRFIQDKLTAATLVYFAFGAEYHQYLIDDVAVLSKLSIPLLMVVAFQSRFDTSYRKKACSLLRRKLPIVLGNFTAVNRRDMPFPVNIIEDAYCKEPKYFRNTDGILTDSEGKTKAEEAVVEKKESKGGNGKGRKKSSKKRH